MKLVLLDVARQDGSQQPHSNPDAASPHGVFKPGLLSAALKDKHDPIYFLGLLSDPMLRELISRKMWLGVPLPIFRGQIHDSTLIVNGAGVDEPRR